MIAQLYAQCIAVLILPRLPNVQIISTVQEAPLPYMVICLTKELVERYCGACHVLPSEEWKKYA